VVVGAIFLAGTWDGLYDALDLPHAQPAIFVQIGGALLWGVAYLLWLAARTPTLMLPVARASALTNGLSAGVLAAWLINGDIENELAIDALGTAIIVGAAALSAVFTVLFLKAGLRSGGYGPGPPPAPDG